MRFLYIVYRCRLTRDGVECDPYSAQFNDLFEALIEAHRILIEGDEDTVVQIEIMREE